MLIPMLPVITESLLNLAIMFSNEVLSLVLETLAMVLAVSSTYIVKINKKIFTRFFMFYLYL